MFMELELAAFFVDLISFTTVLIVANWILRILALFVVPRNRAPTSGLAWLLVIMLVPTLGWVLFLVFGSPKLPKRRRAMQENVDDLLKATDTDHAYRSVPDKYEQTRQLVESLVHMPLSAIERYKLIDDYDQAFHLMARDIDRAKESVNMSFFIMGLDDCTLPVVEALERAAERGVKVRVLYDAYFAFRYRKVFRPLKKRLGGTGTEMVASLPIRLFGKHFTRPDLRNHRKLVMIDRHIGYTGSQNLIDKTYHRRDDIAYKELVVRLTGHAVYHMEIVFAADWYAETGESIYEKYKSVQHDKKKHRTMVHILPSGPGYEDENNLKVFTSLFYAAERSITIVNPYFVPDSALVTALVSAARRGVSVTMINSEAVDQWMVAHAQRSYYEHLMQAGVKIFWHKPPTLVHSKFIIIDDEVATVGSSNMDMRSFLLSHELTLVAYDKSFANALAQVANDYLKSSRQLNPSQWHERARWRQLLDNIARLTSSLQ